MLATVTQALRREALALACCIMLLWALREGRKRRAAHSQPAATIHHSTFRARVCNGDLLGTRASNNWLSRFHSLGLGTPIAHVGIALVEREGDPSGRVYMFESGAPRGAQLRDVDDYMQDGADYLWWRALDVSREARAAIVAEVERAGSLAYSWSFLKNLPQVLAGVDAPCQSHDDAEEASSCADIVAKVYDRAGLLDSASRRAWLPMHFLEDAALGPLGRVLRAPVNVIFEGYERAFEARRRDAIERLASAMEKE